MKKWKMPKWMAQFEPFIRNTGNNDIARLVNGRTDAVINLPLAVLEACVQSQVGLLDSLYQKGWLTVSPSVVFATKQMEKENLAAWTRCEQYRRRLLQLRDRIDAELKKAQDP